MFLTVLSIKVRHFYNSFPCFYNNILFLKSKHFSEIFLQKIKHIVSDVFYYGHYFCFFRFVFPVGISRGVSSPSLNPHNAQSYISHCLTSSLTLQQHSMHFLTIACIGVFTLRMPPICYSF